MCYVTHLLTFLSRELHLCVWPSARSDEDSWPQFLSNVGKKAKNILEAVISHESLVHTSNMLLLVLFSG